MLGLGWEQVTDDSWDLYWCDVGWMREHFDSAFLPDHARVCHFRNHYELTRKDMVVKNLKRLARQLERDEGAGAGAACLAFLPTTYQLPGEYRMFVEEFKRSQASPWIMKPVGRAQGKGIFLFNKLSEITQWKQDTRWAQPRDDDDDERERPESYIVQRYLSNPYLIGGKKFDLRIYVLVTSYTPLRVWLYREGFARFSGALFNMDKSNIANNFIHLTNVAIQKTAKDYDKSKGCKWLMSQVRRYLASRSGDAAVAQLMRDIDNVFIKSLQAVQKVMINDKHCFELYGFDILLDADLKPWLIEVNASPSLTADTETDYKLKYGLLQDTFAVVDLQKRFVCGGAQCPSIAFGASS